MSEEFSTGDLSTLVLTVQENGAAKDISSATAITYIMTKPDLSVVELTAGLHTTGSDGKVSYTFLVADLDVKGQYSIQVAIASPTWTGATSEYTFEVRQKKVAT